MIFLDEESSDVKCIVSCWIRRQPEAEQMKLQGWIDDYFFKALEWVLTHGADHLAVETTKAGVVHGALSHMAGVKSKAAFACAAVRGFGSNTSPTPHPDPNPNPKPRLETQTKTEPAPNLNPNPNPNA